MENAILQFLENLRNTTLNNIFAFFTFFGEETFIVVAICLIYWTVNKKSGEFLLMSVLSSVSANGLLKDSIHRLRPFQAAIVSKVDFDGYLVNTVKLNNSYSFPSGHSQIAGSFFISLSLLIKKKSAYIICSAIIFLVMLSRIYLGVHYPTDVLAGAFLGILFAFLWYFIFKKFYNKRYIIFIVSAVVLSMFLFFSGTTDSFKALGGMLGASVGLYLENKYNNFEIQKNIWKKLLRVVLGFAVILGFKEGLKLILPKYLIFDYIRYFAVIFAATFIYPVIFKKLDF